jgi:hypothetical protein
VWIETWTRVWQRPDKASESSLLLKDAAANNDVNGEGPNDGEPTKVKIRSFVCVRVIPHWSVETEKAQELPIRANRTPQLFKNQPENNSKIECLDILLLVRRFCPSLYCQHKVVLQKVSVVSHSTLESTSIRDFSAVSWCISCRT